MEKKCNGAIENIVVNFVKVMFAVAVIISEHEREKRERESSVDAMIRKIASQQCDLGLQHYLWVEFFGSVLCYEMFFPHFALKPKAMFDLIYCDFI